MRNKFAVIEGNALWRCGIHNLSGDGRPIDKNAQNPVAAAADQVYIDDLDALASANPLGDFNYFVYDSLSVRHLILPLLLTVAANKKVGLRPLALFAN